MGHPEIDFVLEALCVHDGTTAGSPVPLLQVDIVIDGVTLAEGDLVLAVGQEDAKENGVYEILEGGTNAKRHKDFDNSDNFFPGARFKIREGEKYARTEWAVGNPGSFTLDADDLSITQQFVQDNRGRGQTPGSVTVTTTSTEILPANENRKWAIITNKGNVDVFIAIGQTALLDRGMVLGRSGGSITLDEDLMSIEAVNGIVQAGSAVVIFQEGN